MNSKIQLGKSLNDHIDREIYNNLRCRLEDTTEYPIWDPLWKFLGRTLWIQIGSQISDQIDNELKNDL